MKIIDENGMLFGKINIIDLTVFIFVLILLFTGYKYLYLKNYPLNVLDSVIHQEYTWVNVTVRYTEMAPILFERATIGDTQYRAGLGESNVPIARLVNKTALNETDDGVYSELVFEVYVEKKPTGFYYEASRIKFADIFSFDNYVYVLEYGSVWDIEGGWQGYG